MPIRALADKYGYNAVLHEPTELLFITSLTGWAGPPLFPFLLSMDCLNGHLPRWIYPESSINAYFALVSFFPHSSNNEQINAFAKLASVSFYYTFINLLNTVWYTSECFFVFDPVITAETLLLHRFLFSIVCTVLV